MKVKVHVEGGGNRREANARCREGFREFFHRAGLDPRSLRVIPGGARTETYKSFRDDVETGHGEFVVLLVDSEGSLRGSSVWEHLRATDGWTRPDHCTEDHAHLMVQCMEAWFFSDKDCLEAFFGRGFNGNALSRNPNIEEIPKNDLLAGLKNATRQCRPKGEYAKGRHGFAVLAETDPAKVLNASPHAKSLVETLMAHANRR